LQLFPLDPDIVFGITRTPAVLNRLLATELNGDCLRDRVFSSIRYCNLFVRRFDTAPPIFCTPCGEQVFLNNFLGATATFGRT